MVVTTEGDALAPHMRLGCLGVVFVAKLPQHCVALSCSFLLMQRGDIFNTECEENTVEEQSSIKAASRDNQL